MCEVDEFRTRLGLEPVPDDETERLRQTSPISATGSRACATGQLGTWSRRGPLLVQGGFPRGGWDTYIMTPLGLMLLASGYGSPSREVFDAAVQVAVVAAATILTEKVATAMGWCSMADRAIDDLRDAMTAAGGDREAAPARGGRCG